MRSGKAKYVGVDGCPSGWLSIGLDDDGDSEVNAFEEFSALLDYHKEGRPILVDMPIGLIANGLGERACEPKAREVLVARRSSVFDTPTRALVHMAAGGMDFASVNRLSKSDRCEGVSLQAYNILAKVAEVDKVMANNCLPSQMSVREVHPEVCFWALNDKAPMCYGKKSKSASERNKAAKERLHVMEQHDPEITSQTYDLALRLRIGRSRDFGIDDIIDALVAALTAKLSYQKGYELKTLPESPPLDSKGLPMEMVYVEAVTSTP